MKRLILAAALFTSVNAHGTGIPVVDVANVIQRTVEHGLTMTEMALHLDEMIRTYEQVRDSHEAMTGIRNLGDVFDSPALRAYLPDDWLETYDNIHSGYDALSGDAVDMYNKYKVYDACQVYSADDRRKQCELKAIRGVLIKTENLKTALLISERAEQLRELQAEINKTEDPKAINELQARISIEQATIANEATRLQIQRQTLEADQLVHQQRDLEFNARTFSANQGVAIEPLTFSTP